MVIITIVYRIVNLVGSVANQLKTSGLPLGTNTTVSSSFLLGTSVGLNSLSPSLSQSFRSGFSRWDSYRISMWCAGPWNKYRIAWRNWTDFDLLRCVSTNDFTRLPQMNPRSDASAWNALCRPWWFTSKPRGVAGPMWPNMTKPTADNSIPSSDVLQFAWDRGDEVDTQLLMWAVPQSPSHQTV